MAVIVETLMAEDLEYGVNTTSKTHPGGGTLNGHQISLSTLSLAGASGTASTKSHTFSTVTAGGYQTTTIEVPGAAVGDKVLVSFSTIGTETLMISAHVSDANTVTVVIFNPTASQVSLSAGTLSVLVFRHR